MPNKNITVTGSTDMDLLNRASAIEKINKLPTDQLKRLSKLIDNPKALKYLSSDDQFKKLEGTLKMFG